MTMAGLSLEVRGVHKAFPGVLALQDVAISLRGGTIHALLGENGAGKSTLIKIITGVHRPDGGELLLDGVPVRFAGPREAIAAGIGVVHQERNLIPRFSVGENIGLERLGGGFLGAIDYDAIHAEARKWLEVLELDLDPRAPVSQLNVAKVQLVEIAKALSLRSRVLLLDEPTASLTPQEAQVLFRLLRKLRNEGASLLFVSHKLEEVQDICDEVTVLRDGRNACPSQPMAGLVRQDLVRLMIGRNEQIPAWPPRSVEGAPTLLELKDVSTSLGHAGIDLKVRKGEIVGLYGLVGAGRTELAKCILGQHAITAGEVAVEGDARKIAGVADAIHKRGIGYISEDRKQEGLILTHTVLENAGITIWRKLASRFGLLRNETVRAHVAPVIAELEVRTPSLAQTVGNLSGGNQQKISVAKWLAAGVKILIVDEPSVGIDIKTKAYIHELLRRLADEGTAILLITSDMPEMITLADRIVVMDDYRIKGEIANTRDYAGMGEGIMALIHARNAA
jgi:ribose transport system ATP-binding protein